MEGQGNGQNSSSRRWTCEACGCNTNAESDRTCSICGTSNGKSLYDSVSYLGCRTVGCVSWNVSRLVSNFWRVETYILLARDEVLGSFNSTGFEGSAELEARMLRYNVLYRKSGFLGLKPASKTRIQFRFGLSWVKSFSP